MPGSVVLSPNDRGADTVEPREFTDVSANSFDTDDIVISLRKNKELSGILKDNLQSEVVGVKCFYCRDADTEFYSLLLSGSKSNAKSLMQITSSFEHLSDDSVVPIQAAWLNQLQRVVCDMLGEIRRLASNNVNKLVLPVALCSREAENRYFALLALDSWKQPDFTSYKMFTKYLNLAQSIVRYKRFGGTDLYFGYFTVGQSEGQLRLLQYQELKKLDTKAPLNLDLNRPIRTRGPVRSRKLAVPERDRGGAVAHPKEPDESKRPDSLMDLVAGIREQVGGGPLTVFLHGWGDDSPKKLLDSLRGICREKDSFWLVVNPEAMGDLATPPLPRAVELDLSQDKDRRMYRNQIGDIVFFPAASEDELSRLETWRKRVNCVIIDGGGAQAAKLAQAGSEADLDTYVWHGGDKLAPAVKMSKR